MPTKGAIAMKTILRPPAFVFATLGAALAGCSAQNASPGYPAAMARVPVPFASPAVRRQAGRQPRGWIKPGAMLQRLVYVADGNKVLIYPERGRNKAPVGEITDGVGSAYGLWIDAYGSLYVANQYGNNVTVYAPGKTTPKETFSDKLHRPLYPLVDRVGNLWVGNADNGTVVEYRHGHRNANEVLQTAGTEVDGMDFDQQGNLYVAYRNHDAGSIEEFPKGSTQGKILGMTLNQPQSVIVTNDGTILTVETGGTDRIDVFPPGYEQPTLEVGVSDIPTELAITSSERNLYVSSIESGYIYVSPYPLLNPNGSPNVLHRKIEVGGDYAVQGMALSNGQVF
jgi:hypothetical protein